MAEEPETTVQPPDPIQEKPSTRLAVRVEVDAKKAVQAVEGFTSDLEAQLHQHIDTFWADVVTNIGSQVPTEIHNQLHDLKEALRSRLVGLFHKEN